MSLRKSSESDGSRGEALARPEQLAKLRELALAARDDQAFDESLTPEEVERRIAALKAKIAEEQESGVDRRPRT